MNIQLLKAVEKDKEVLQNLMQLYMYDFTEYTMDDVDASGLYSPYAHLPLYWQQPQHRFPYLAMQDGKYIGFVLVRYVDVQQGYFSMAEFFVMKKYRRQGAGRNIATQVFDLHLGRWQVRQMENNLPAQLFWRKVIDAYTSGWFTEYKDNKRTVQEFDNTSFGKKLQQTNY